MESFNYMLELYMDDYIVLAIPKIQDQLHHVANAILTGIHDVFPPDKYDKEDAISLRKFLKNRKSGLGKESTEKRVSPLDNFEPILQN